MSLIERKWGKKTYFVFKMPGPSELYIGPTDKPIPSRVRQAIAYVLLKKEKTLAHYDELESQLLGMLAGGEEREYAGGKK